MRSRWMARLRKPGAIVRFDPHDVAEGGERFLVLPLHGERHAQAVQAQT